MSKKHSTVTLALDELLRESKRQTTSMSLPLPVHHRLDLLAELAVAVSATRAEIIGMLISEADLDGVQLEQRIVTYRKKTVGQVVPPKPGESRNGDDGNVVTLPVRHAGRPPVHRAAG
jgi:hypothetical protein